jgi:hypothetical protein
MLRTLVVRFIIVFYYRIPSLIPTLDITLVHYLLQYACYRTSLLVLKTNRTLVVRFIEVYLLQEDVVDI